MALWGAGINCDLGPVRVILVWGWGSGNRKKTRGIKKTTNDSQYYTNNWKYWQENLENVTFLFPSTFPYKYLS